MDQRTATNIPSLPHDFVMANKIDILSVFRFSLRYLVIFRADQAP